MSAIKLNLGAIVECYVIYYQQRRQTKRRMSNVQWLRWVSLSEKCLSKQQPRGRNCPCVCCFWQKHRCATPTRGNSLKSPCPGCEQSAIMLLVRVLLLDMWLWIDGRSVQNIISTELTVPCGLWWPNQTRQGWRNREQTGWRQNRRWPAAPVVN